MVYQEHPQTSAFTLLEMMIVLVIMGIVVSVALFAFMPFDRSRELKSMKMGLMATVRFARDQARLQDFPVSVHFTSRGYCLQRLREDRRWHAWPIDSLACQTHHNVLLRIHRLDHDTKHTFFTLPLRLVFMPDGTLLDLDAPLLIQLQSSTFHQRIKLAIHGEVVS